MAICKICGKPVTSGVGGHTKCLGDNPDKMHDLAKQLRRLAIEHRPEACLGCCFEHGCSVHGCAVIKRAAATLASLVWNRGWSKDGRESAGEMTGKHLVYVEDVKSLAESMVLSGRPEYANAEIRGFRKALNLLDAVPQVDAVPVVRCQDCIHVGPEVDAITPGNIRRCSHYNCFVKRDGFCSDGEGRKQNERTEID